MKNYTKIAVIGGTGKSGKYLVQELPRQGFSIKLLVRNPKNFKINNEHIEVIYGDVRDYEVVRSIIQGCSVVLSTLGGTPLSEPTVFSQATKNILRAMAEFGIKRYVVTTGLNVNTSFDKKGVITQAGTDWMHVNFPKSTADRQHEYDLLLESTVDWTLIRLPLIELTDERRETKTSLEDCLGENISATDLANFIVEQIDDCTFIQKAPFLANI